MSVLVRLAGALFVGGLVAGVVLRFALSRERLPALVLLSLVPWPLHAAYVTITALGDGASPAGALAFVAGGLALALAGAWLGVRSTRRRPLLAALTPALVAAAYGLAPFALYSLALRRAAVDLDIIPTAAYFGACLFASAALLVFVPSPPVREGGPLARLARRGQGPRS